MCTSQAVMCFIYLDIDMTSSACMYLLERTIFSFIFRKEREVGLPENKGKKSDLEKLVSVTCGNHLSLVLVLRYENLHIICVYYAAMIF